MGKHRHFRLCIDGCKVHSSGGYSRESLDRWIEENGHCDIKSMKPGDSVTINIPIGKAPFGFSGYEDSSLKRIQTKRETAVVFLLTRLENHSNRRCTGILFSKPVPTDVDLTDFTNCIIFVKTDMYFNLADENSRNRYDNLGLIYSPRFFSATHYSTAQFSPVSLIE